MEAPLHPSGRVVAQLGLDVFPGCSMPSVPVLAVSCEQASVREMAKVSPWMFVEAVAGELDLAGPVPSPSALLGPLAMSGSWT